MRVWQRLAAALCVVLCTSPAWATTEEFHVIAAGVDDLSTKANEKAFAYAKYRALYLAIEKLGVGDPAVAASRISAEQMQQIVRGATILNTKRQDNITYQEVLVTIVQEPLRNALGVPSAESDIAANSHMRPVLVLPVLVSKERPYLWEKENSWRPALADAVLTQSHGKVMMAAGDFGDLRLIDYQNALKVKSEELKPMFERYGAEEIIIAVLTPGAPNTQDASNVLLRRMTPTGETSEVMDVLPKNASDSLPERLLNVSKAAASAITQIAASTAVSDQKVLEKASHVAVSFIYANPRELAEMQVAVRAVSGVIQLEIPEISLKDINGTIYFTGDKDKLLTALSKQGVHVREANDKLILSMR
jgi:hypothetical protein